MPGAPGTDTIDFGAASAWNNVATKVITGISGITSAAHIEGWIQGNDSTADHDATEHGMAAPYITFAGETIVAGTGFTMRAHSGERPMHGQFVFHYVWFVS